MLGAQTTTCFTQFELTHHLKWEGQLKAIGILAACIVASITVATQANATSVIDFGGSIAVPPNKLAQIKTIGVISVIGDLLTLKEVGTTAFSNSESKLPIADWDIDGLVERDTANALANRVAVQLTTVANRNAFANAEGRLFHSIDDELGDLVKALPQPGPDAYLVIVPNDVADPIGGTNQHLINIGLYHRDFLGKSSSTEYAFFLAWLIDAKTGTMLARAGSCLPANDNPCAQIAAIPAADQNWADTADQLTDVQKQRLKVDFTNLVHGGMQGMLFELGLSIPNQPTTTPVPDVAH